MKKPKTRLIKKLEARTRANKLRRPKSALIIHCCGFNHEGECTPACYSHGDEL